MNNQIKEQVIKILDANKTVIDNLVSDIKKDTLTIESLENLRFVYKKGSLSIKNLIKLCKGMEK